jgi:hypothetical protein
MGADYVKRANSGIVLILAVLLVLTSVLLAVYFLQNALNVPDAEGNPTIYPQNNGETINKSPENERPQPELTITEPLTHALDDMLKRFGDDLSVYYENTESGFVYRYNAERVYFGASLSKAALALFIFTLAEEGKINPDEKLTFTHNDLRGGSGVIRHHYGVGSEFTIRELIRLNLSESDNVATMMLRRRAGVENYRAFIAELGANPDLVRDRVMNSYLTANDAGIFAREIYRYLESDGRYTREFKDALIDNRFPFTVPDYLTASKTGWTDYLAWHCLSIIYAPSPYILVIMSQRRGWEESDFADFAEISMAFQHFNAYWFYP